MGERLPGLTAKEVVKALEKTGFVAQRQKGSHLTMRHPQTKHTTVITMHPGEMPRVFLKTILKQAGIREDAFRELI
jgi:predicted RNA binding protein YcfA (HicA-like mRNA interferase family)